MIYRTALLYCLASETQKTVAQFLLGNTRKWLLFSDHSMVLELLLRVEILLSPEVIFMTQITRFLCFCAVLIAFSAPRAKADATYTYTGNAFTGFFGSDSCVAGIGECQFPSHFQMAFKPSPT